MKFSHFCQLIVSLFLFIAVDSVSDLPGGFIFSSSFVLFASVVSEWGKGEFLNKNNRYAEEHVNMVCMRQSYELSRFFSLTVDTYL